MTEVNAKEYEKKIYVALCQKYHKDIIPITEISKNTTSGRDFVVSAERALNYDKVTNCSTLYPIETDEKSPDSLFFHGRTLYFVEFKEGVQIKKIDIRGKIYEGITTLYHFARKYVNVSRDDFLKLNIHYLVFQRPIKKKQHNSFLHRLNLASTEYNLRNLEGFIVKKARVIDDPQFFADFFYRVSNGRINKIEIFNHHDSKKYSEFVAQKVQPRKKFSKQFLESNSRYKESKEYASDND